MSVAVLDFQNLSRDTGDAYLGQGIASELTTRLGQVSRLTVASRAAVQRLRNPAEMQLADMGRSLNAAYLVSGSVQRSGPRLRVSAELVRVSTGASVWTDQYDRSETDLLAIQEAVATAVAGAVTGRLLPDERTVLAVQPTRNPEAHAAWLRGRAMWAGTQGNKETAEAIASFERAVALDSGYLDAWSELAQAHAQLYWQYGDRTEARVERSRLAAERARAIAPDAAATHMAWAAYYYWGRRDYPRAITELSAALRLEPNAANVHTQLANIARRQGDWDRAVASRLRGLELDPENSSELDDLSLTYSAMRRFDDAERAAERSVLIDPAQLGSPFQAYAWAARDGSLRRVPERAAAIAGSPTELINGLFKDPGFTLAVVRASDEVQAGIVRMPVPANPVERAAYFLVSGEAQVLRQRGPDAATAFDSARGLLVSLVAARPDDEGFHAGLALTYEGLNDCPSALREAERATTILPVERDALSGPEYLVVLAEIEAHCGRADQAIARLGSLLDRPSTVTVTLLRSDPAWSPLRGNPRFEALLAGR